MIEEIKKDLRAQVEDIQENGRSMNEWSWGGMKGVLLSGAEALALLEYIEGLEKHQSDSFLDEISENLASLNVKASWLQQAVRGVRPDFENPDK